MFRSSLKAGTIATRLTAASGAPGGTGGERLAGQHVIAARQHVARHAPPTFRSRSSSSCRARWR